MKAQKPLKNNKKSNSRLQVLKTHMLAPIHPV